MNSSKNINEISFNYTDILSMPSVFGNLMVLAGILVNHYKLYPLDVLTLFICSSIHMVTNIFYFVISVFDINSITFCYMNALNNNLFIYYIILLLLMSYNRLYLILMSIISKKVIKKENNQSLRRYKCWFLLALGLFGLIVLLDILFITNKNIYELVDAFNCRISKYNPTYFLAVKVVFVLFADFLLMINSFIIIPILVLKYKHNNRHTKTSIMQNKTMRSLIILSVKLCIFTFIILIGWSFDSINILLDLYIDKDINDENFNTQIHNFAIPVEIINPVYFLDPFVLIILNKIIRDGIILIVKRICKIFRSLC